MKYKSFIEQKELAKVVDESFDVLRRNNIDPFDFYDYIIENQLSEERLDELLRGLGNRISSGFRGLKAGIGSSFANYSARNRETERKRLEDLKATDPAKFAAMGFTDDMIAKATADRDASQNQYNQGFKASAGNAYNASRGAQNTANAATDDSNMLAKMQRRYGVNPYTAGAAATPAATPAPPVPSPVPPPVGGGGGSPSPTPVGSGGSPSPTPTPTPTPPGGFPSGMTPATVAAELTKIGRKNPANIKAALTSFIASLTSGTP